MNITELKAPQSDCPYCNGTGEADSGGIHPWGEPATIPCRCMYEDPFHVHVSAYNRLAAQLEESRAQMERQKDEWLSWEAKRRDLEKAAAQLEDAQGEIRALRATEAGLIERVKVLEEGLMSIHEWNSHTVQYSIDYGSNGVRDFYRGIARALLEKQQ